MNIRYGVESSAYVSVRLNLMKCLQGGNTVAPVAWQALSIFSDFWLLHLYFRSSQYIPWFSTPVPSSHTVSIMVLLLSPVGVFSWFNYESPIRLRHSCVSCNLCEKSLISTKTRPVCLSATCTLLWFHGFVQWVKGELHIRKSYWVAYRPTSQIDSLVS